MTAAASEIPFLRIPPFPGSKVRWLSRRAEDAVSPSDEEIDRVGAALAEARVGGAYWAAQPALPDSAYILVRTANRDVRDRALAEASVERPIVLWDSAAVPLTSRACPQIWQISGPADPWHLVRRAGEVVVDGGDEVALVAALAGVPLRCIGAGRFADLEKGGRGALRKALRASAIQKCIYASPFTGEPMTLAEVIELCRFWRDLIDSNRELTAAMGFAFWKRPTVAPLLWNGTSDTPFAGRLGARSAEGKVAVWKSRTSARNLAGLQRGGAQLVEVEDGFIRSSGLGAECVPPLSIVVDRTGIYFDPRRPSDLESLLEQGDFAPAMIERARRLRERIVRLGVSKYGAGTTRLERRAGGRRHLLVAGQVEDDRSVLLGGDLVRTNLELLTLARKQARDAYIIYKPHPDVVAGLRRGSIPDELCLTIADEIARDAPIGALIDFADDVHVNTSLAGFEALLRGKQVTTYGVPFYAGWGLTCDLGAVPARRTARRTLDELVAAALLVYPRYFDPLSGLPCPAEIVISRMTDGGSNQNKSPVVGLRRLQGRLARGWR